uniref:Procollagen C-endopeptidase enhancer 2 n=2 Tax=Canis lupus familiaris TaxID=9615 RepID=A0A8C0RDU9_CANLF
MRGAGAWAALGLLLAAAAQRSPQQPPERPVFTCGGILTGESGFIGSEGFPGVYPPNSKCTWKITVPEGKVVVLNFRFIDLESDNLCRYDFVDVYNGHTNGQRIGRFCGTFRPGALVSSGNKMMVQMISDANTAGNGFMAMFSAAEPNERGDQYCGGRLERPSGSFKTPNWPDRDYPAGVTCMWHIVAPKNQLIELKFEKFDVERDNYCRYDFVAVFNGGEVNDAKRIGKYCGDSPPAVGWHCDHNCHPRWEFACHSLYHQHLRGKFGNSAGWQEHECQGHRGLQAVPAPQKRSELHYYGPSG